MSAPQRVLTALAAAASVVLTTAPSALALSEDTRDPGRDVLSAPLYTDALPKRPEPARRAGDITRSTVVLGTDLVATTRFRSLDLAGEQDFSWLLLTSTDAKQGSWIAYLTVPAGKDKGHFQLIDPEGNQPGCAKAVLDRAGRTLTLTVPAACLGDPAWVKVANGLMVVTKSRAYFDDARRDGGVRHGWKYGPRVTP